MSAIPVEAEKKVTQPSDVVLDRAEALDLLYQMILIRRFEEKCAELYSAQKIRGFLHLYIGEEAVAVGIMKMLRPEDAVVATYREHGQALARGVPIGPVMAEMYGKQEGCSRGRGGSMHIFHKETRFYGGNAIVGGGLPLAVGFGLADQMRFDPHVTACFFGDGAVAEGEFHESMNLAVLWNLPVLFICENNLYGMGTALEYAESETDLAAKAASYRMEAESVDGMDILAVLKAAKRGVEWIRNGNGPYFIEACTYRFRAHSMFDAELYREKTEVETWKAQDPIERFSEMLREEGMMNDADLAAIEERVAREVAESVEFAEAGTWEPIEDLTRFVYSEPDPNRRV
ncbi:MAG: pyruvate dehydrogenase (acetyl-transferring) E1 component subunit alpha [Ardenticatenaceae bacterium]|nr:pyruvate dehydrogenase (acetyl-transferring) E1 component subunit alpha [Ardenticatenaceae bacterium]